MQRPQTLAEVQRLVEWVIAHIIDGHLPGWNETSLNEINSVALRSSDSDHVERDLLLGG